LTYAPTYDTSVVQVMTHGHSDPVLSSYCKVSLGHRCPHFPNVCCYCVDCFDSSLTFSQPFCHWMQALYVKQSFPCSVSVKAAREAMINSPTGCTHFHEQRAKLAYIIPSICWIEEGGSVCVFDYTSFSRG